MNFDTDSDNTPFLFKGAVLMLVAIFTVIGIIGLILPVIPGIIFLALAALLLAKISRRFAFFLDNQPLWQKLKRQWHSVQFLSIDQRIKLMGWYCLRGVMNSLETVIQALRKRFD